MSCDLPLPARIEWQVGELFLGIAAEAAEIVHQALKGADAQPRRHAAGRGHWRHLGGQGLRPAGRQARQRGQRASGRAAAICQPGGRARWNGCWRLWLAVTKPPSAHLEASRVRQAAGVRVGRGGDHPTRGRAGCVSMTTGGPAPARVKSQKKTLVHHSERPDSYGTLPCASFNDFRPTTYGHTACPCKCAR